MATCFRMIWHLWSFMICTSFFFRILSTPKGPPGEMCWGPKKRVVVIWWHKFSQNRHGKSPWNPYCWLYRHVFNHENPWGSEVFYGLMLWCFTDWTHTSRVLSLPPGSKWTDFPWGFSHDFSSKVWAIYGLGLDGLAEGVTFRKHFFARLRKNIEIHSI